MNRKLFKVAQANNQAHGRWNSCARTRSNIPLCREKEDKAKTDKLRSLQA